MTPDQVNILVDESGDARIADFGRTTVTQNPDSMQSTSCQHGYTPRWTAPEVIREGPHSKEADVFGFAMVMIEVRHSRCTACRTFTNYSSTSMKVFTGAVPFRDSSTHAAIFAILQGERPSRPTHPSFTEDLWTLTQHCWDQDPHSRPEVSEVVEVLRGSSVSPQSQRPSVSLPGYFLLYSGSPTQQRPTERMSDTVPTLPRVEHRPLTNRPVREVRPSWLPQNLLHQLYRLDAPEHSDDDTWDQAEDPEGSTSQFGRHRRRGSLSVQQSKHNVIPSVTGQPTAQELIDAMDEGSVVIFPSPTKLTRSAGT